MIPFLKKNKDGGKKPPKSMVPRTAQESIPFQRMFEDGTCRVRPGYYTRTIQYQDMWTASASRNCRAFWIKSRNAPLFCKLSRRSAMPRSAIPPSAGKRGLNMNFNHEELTLMMLYNTGTRLGLIHELRLMQCYLMPDEAALRKLSEQVIEKLKLLTDAEFAELEFPPN